uniref:Uncharacterized protein n=1 Tax=Arundo donax TaxID=35708 RepID=A0A0A8YIY1_ARUDO
MPLMIFTLSLLHKNDEFFRTSQALSRSHSESALGSLRTPAVAYRKTGVCLCARLGICLSAI